MSGGFLQQYDTPLAIYNRPRNLFVARFIGSPSMNLLAGRLSDDGGTRQLELGPLGQVPVADAALAAQCARAEQPEIVLGIRPEDLALGPRNGAGGGLDLTVSFVERIASRTIVHFGVGEQVLKAVTRNTTRVEVGEPLTVTMKPEACRLFDAASQLAVAGA